MKMKIVTLVFIALFGIYPIWYSYTQFDIFKQVATVSYTVRETRQESDGRKSGGVEQISTRSSMPKELNEIHSIQETNIQQQGIIDKITDLQFWVKWFGIFNTILGLIVITHKNIYYLIQTVQSTLKHFKKEKDTSGNDTL